MKIQIQSIVIYLNYSGEFESLKNVFLSVSKIDFKITSTIS